MSLDSYRPLQWSEYIGQRKLKDELQIRIRGSLKREEALDHVFLHGPPGCGKTTIAKLIAQEMGMEFESFIMPIKKELVQKIVAGFDGVVLFDELHRLSVKDQETLLPLIEDHYYQTPTGAKLYAGALTIVGATTELDEIIKPLYERFKIKPIFQDYTDKQMGQIVREMAQKAGLHLSIHKATALGKATGGIPRNAKTIVSMARDLDTDDVDLILQKCHLTKDGLNQHHVKYLTLLADSGNSVGLDMLVAHLQLSKAIVVSLEKLLVKRNLIEYSPKGRTLTQHGWAALKEQGYKYKF